MKLIRINFFVKMILPNLAIAYKKVDGKIFISGFYRKVKLKVG